MEAKVGGWERRRRRGENVKKGGELKREYNNRKLEIVSSLKGMLNAFYVFKSRQKKRKEKKRKEKKRKEKKRKERKFCK